MEMEEIFDKLQAVADRYDELNELISDPEVIADSQRFMKLSKEEGSLRETVEKYNQYKKVTQTISDDEELLRETNDDDLTALTKEELAEAREEQAQLEKELEEVSTSKADEDKEMHDELASLMQQREEQASKIKKSTLMKYDRVRAHRHNIGIASVKDEVCNGCYMHIPPQLYVEVKKDLEVHTCPHCQRILYYIPPKPADDAKK